MTNFPTIHSLESRHAEVIRSKVHGDARIGFRREVQTVTKPIGDRSHDWIGARCNGRFLPDGAVIAPFWFGIRCLSEGRASARPNPFHDARSIPRRSRGSATL